VASRPSLTQRRGSETDGSGSTVTSDSMQTVRRILSDRSLTDATFNTLPPPYLRKTLSPSTRNHDRRLAINACLGLTHKLVNVGAINAQQPCMTLASHSL